MATGIVEDGACGIDAVYHVADRDLATGSTLCAPKAVTVIKATGAIAKVFSVDAGKDLFGTVVLHHWDARTGMALRPLPGTVSLHPAHQERRFSLRNDVEVHEAIFALDRGPHHGDCNDPPAVYYRVTLHNLGEQRAELATYAFCQLRGNTEHDIVADYDPDMRAIIAWNESRPEHVRLFGCSEQPAGYAVTLDYGASVSEQCPGTLSCETSTSASDPLGVLHVAHALAPGERVEFAFLLSLAAGGRDAALAAYRACPSVHEALAGTIAYYREVLSRAIVLTPNEEINRGALWAKVNMLRSEVCAPSGWAFTNDPTRSSNSVARDTSWFGFGADYITPEFMRSALRAFLERQQERGMIVEYYNMLTNETADDDLNVNDDTPLLIHAVWHHYCVTGDRDFLRESYPVLARAARYILSQRNEQGLVWCTATAIGPRGIVGWRNAMQDYRLSGATTELNAECYGALRRVAEMAHVVGRSEEQRTFDDEAEALKRAMNAHLFNPDNGLYYLHIDVDGRPRSDVTSDLVFPVMFGVASDETAAHIIRRLSGTDFWTEAGIRVVPRDAANYSPDHESGLMGGVWVGVSYWFAFAAARFSSQFMEHALSAGFQQYSRNPRQNNTVPGQFSEWLHGETLVNRGMMLSPWFPPRYLWAALEGAAGLSYNGGEACIRPVRSSHWPWLAVRRLPYRGRHISWLIAHTPEPEVYTTYRSESDMKSQIHHVYEEDVTSRLGVQGDAAVALALRRGSDFLLFAGNTHEHTVGVTLWLDMLPEGTYRGRAFDSLAGRWIDRGDLCAAAVRRGLTLSVERKGFQLVQLAREGS
jgi:hypothetical protein